MSSFTSVMQGPIGTQYLTFLNIEKRNDPKTSLFIAIYEIKEGAESRPIDLENLILTQPIKLAM